MLREITASCDQNVHFWRVLEMASNAEISLKELRGTLLYP